MLTDTEARDAMGQTLYDNDGDKIGKVAQVYLSDATGAPEFLTVTTGMFGGNESFVPAGDARVSQDGLTVPFSKDKVKDAPNVAADGHLEVDEEQALYDYYGMTSAPRRLSTSTATTPTVRRVTEPTCRVPRASRVTTPRVRPPTTR